MANVGIYVQPKTGDVSVTGNIYPSACNVYDLGSAGRRWKDLYLSGNTIDLGGTKISRDANGGGIRLVSETGGTADSRVKNLFADGTITASNLNIVGDYVTMRTTTSNTEMMVIENAGTGPALKVTQTGVNSIAEFYDDGGVLALKIADGGNVGIGTSTPLQMLHVAGAIKATTSINSDTQFLGQGTDSANAPSFSFIDDTNTGIFRPVADNVGITCGGTERVRVLSNGNVGIGTTQPQSKLHIVKGELVNIGDALKTSYTDGGFTAASLAMGYNSASLTGPTGGIFTWTSGTFDTGGGAITLSSFTPISGATYQISITASSTYTGLYFQFETPSFNVLYASPSLTSTLTTYTAIATAGTGSGANTFVLRIQGGAASTGKTFSWNAFSVKRLDTICTGNVGIGTTNPQAKLHVEGIVKADGFLSPFLSVKCTTVMTFTPFFTWIKVQFNSIVKDSRGEFNITSNSYNPKIAGYYLCNASVFVQPTSQVTSSMIGIWKNGVEPGGLGNYSPYCSTRPIHTLSITGCIYMDGVNDYIDVRVLFDNGGTVSLNTDAYRTYWNAILVSPGI